MVTSELIERPQYTDWLQRWKDRDVIKVITGLRRCGKSMVLELFRRSLVAKGIAESRIISINFESLDAHYPTDYQSLYDYIVERLQPNCTNYVFLDEVQHVEHFEKAADGLYVRDDVDLYITGSNANLLSSELATLLTGRYVELKMLPLSFSEYRNALQSTANDNALFDRYLTYGGLPQVVQAQNASCTDSTTPPNRPDRPAIAGSGAIISGADGSGDRQSA